jgi:putative endonuclease
MIDCAWVYILTNCRDTVLYVGVTNSIATRLWEHGTKQNLNCFTARYNTDKLAYYEGFPSIVEAIAREKFIKGKSRKWKEALIQKMNPEWSDLVAVAQSL